MLEKSILFLSVMLFCHQAVVFASGYRVPEQSVSSTALSCAYVANTDNADAAYYNPANMSWLMDGMSAMGGLTYINLPAINYNDNRSPALSSKSEVENFLIPHFFIVSPEYHNFRFGFALTFPAGLAKRWEDPFPRTFAQEFSMTVTEANPSLSYKISDRLSIGLGIRLLYGKATAKSNGVVTVIPAGALGDGKPSSTEYTRITRDMDGDATEFGYNLALTFKPLPKLALATTYRSEVNLDMDGNGTLSASNSFPNNLIAGKTYQGPGSVSIPVPAVLSLAVAYSFDKATLEFAYDRTYWSTYKDIDFNYPVNLGHPALTAAFDNPVTKNWEDVDAFRLGLTYPWNTNLTLMAGCGVDGNPIPDSTLFFDLPDSNAWFASFGGKYKQSEHLFFGAAYVYLHKKDRAVINNVLNGTFSGGGSHLLTISVICNF